MSEAMRLMGVEASRMLFTGVQLLSSKSSDTQEDPSDHTGNNNIQLHLQSHVSLTNVL